MPEPADVFRESIGAFVGVASPRGLVMAMAMAMAMAMRRGLVVLLCSAERFQLYAFCVRCLIRWRTCSMGRSIRR